MNIETSSCDWELIRDALVYFRRDLHMRLDQGETGFYRDCLTHDAYACDRLVNAIENEKVREATRCVQS
jgi:hypothetical protein